MADKRQLVINNVEQLKYFLYSNTEISNGTDPVEFRYYFNNYTDSIIIKVFFGRDFIYRNEYSYDDFLATPICVLANRIVEARDQYIRSKHGFDINASTYCKNDTKITNDLYRESEGKNNMPLVKVKDAQGNWKDALDYDLYRNILNSTYGIPKNNLIKKVIFNGPATIVFWYDGTKTVVKSDKDDFDKEKGLAMAISKKALGNKGNYYNEFKKWIGDD